MAKIIAPNSKFNGKRAGIAFVDGVAHTDDEGAARYFAKHGYNVEGFKSQTPKPVETAPVPQDEAKDLLASLSVDELRTYAAERDIDLAGARTKGDIKAAIAAAVPVADSPQD